MHSFCGSTEVSEKIDDELKQRLEQSTKVNGEVNGAIESRITGWAGNVLSRTVVTYSGRFKPWAGEWGLLTMSPERTCLAIRSLLPRWLQMSLNLRDHKYVLLWKLKFFQEIPPTPHLVIWLDREVCLIPWLSLSKARYSKPASCSLLTYTQSCLTLCNPRDCSTSGFPVPHHLLEFAQSHVHWVDDATQPSHLLSPPSPPDLSCSQHQGLFQWLGSLHQVAKLLELQLQYQSFQWISHLQYIISAIEISLNLNQSVTSIWYAQKANKNSLSGKFDFELSHKELLKK